MVVSNEIIDDYNVTLEGELFLLNISASTVDKNEVDPLEEEIISAMLVAREIVVQGSAPMRLLP